MSTKVHLVKAMVFQVVMYGCESWTIKKAERQRIDAFELWCWRNLLQVPWPARRSNQSILKEISPEYSLKGLMLKLKLQYFGHLMQSADSFEKTLILGRIKGVRRRGWQRMRWLDGIIDQWTWVWMDSGSWWWTGRPGVLQFMGLQRVGHNWATELNWSIKEMIIFFIFTYCVTQHKPKEKDSKFESGILQGKTWIMYSIRYSKAKASLQFASCSNMLVKIICNIPHLHLQRTKVPQTSSC